MKEDELVSMIESYMLDNETVPMKAKVRLIVILHVDRRSSGRNYIMKIV